MHKDKCKCPKSMKRRPKSHKKSKKFYERTDIPCVLNTSFNLKGEPIVENPKQAIEDFLKTAMDYLVIENFLVSKTNHKG